MEQDFIRRTYRSVAVVTAFVLFMLASYRQNWALLPVLFGAAFGVALLYGMEQVVTRAFTPQRALDVKKKIKGAGPGRPILFFALVKYPLVALLIWTVVHFWNPQQVMAFTGGFILIQLVIGLRAMGRFLVDRMNETPAVTRRVGAGRKE